jgi:hypothetical protein
MIGTQTQAAQSPEIRLSPPSSPEKSEKTSSEVSSPSSSTYSSNSSHFSESSKEDIKLPPGILDKGSLLEQWVDDYFVLFYPNACSTSRAEDVVHQLLNHLLAIGHEELT